MGTTNEQQTWLGTTSRAATTTIVIVALLFLGQFLVSSVEASEQQPEATRQAPPHSETHLGETLMRMEAGMAEDADVALSAGWYTCTVHRAGPGWGNVYVAFSSSSFSARCVRARDDQKNEILATALTSVSTGKTMSVYVTGTDPSNYGEIRAFYVNK